MARAELTKGCGCVVEEWPDAAAWFFPSSFILKKTRHEDIVWRLVPELTEAARERSHRGCQDEVCDPRIFGIPAISFQTTTFNFLSFLECLSGIILTGGRVLKSIIVTVGHAPRVHHDLGLRGTHVKDTTPGCGCSCVHTSSLYDKQSSSVSK